MSTTISRIRSNEPDALRQVRLAALQDSPAAFGGRYGASVRLSHDHWAGRANRSSSGSNDAYFVAESDGGLVGMVGAFTLENRPTHRHLISMWVEPDHRRKGIARRLADALLAWCEDCAAEQIGLWVVDTNDAAISLYEAVGFEKAGVSHPLESDPALTEVLMLNRLRSGF